MNRRRSTATSSFGVGKREGHNASAFYERFAAPVLSDDETVAYLEVASTLGRGQSILGSSTTIDLPDNSVALVVTSPPYFVGKDYETAFAGNGTDHEIPTSYIEFLELLRDVFAECARVLEPGGRIAVNVANLGRKPYRSLSADITTILQDDLGLLLRGEVLWQKGKTSSGSCAWGSFAKAGNPVLRDVTERVIIASKGRFSRAIKPAERVKQGLPNRSTLTNDEFVDATKDVWEFDAESATRIGHPAPFPVDLPRRLIELYTYVDDIVLDPFGGAGTTLVAAARTGRIGVCYDIDPDFVALAASRLETELERADGLASAATDLAAGDALTGDERQDLNYTRALAASKKVGDIAKDHLIAAGFTITKEGPKVPGAGIDFDFEVGASDGSRFYVDVAGAYTSAKPGLQRVELLWRTIGRIQVLKAVDPSARVLVLTPSAPRPKTQADRAIRLCGPSTVFDLIELFDQDALERLSHYASGGPVQPGFWTAQQTQPD
ncbi:MAG: site-specific DNA-methyltransferase [Acidimicrobiales bacterium]